MYDDTTDLTARANKVLPLWPVPSDAHAKLINPEREIITRRVSGDIVRTTYGELYDLSKQVSNALKADGIGLGDRVATLAMNSTDLLEVHAACAKLGAIFFPLNWRLAAPEIEAIVADAAPALLIVDAELAHLAPAAGAGETRSVDDRRAVIDAAPVADPVADGRVAAPEPD